MFLTPRRVISRCRNRFPGTGENIGGRIEQILSVRIENVRSTGTSGSCLSLGENHGLVSDDYSDIYTE